MTIHRIYYSLFYGVATAWILDALAAGAVPGANRIWGGILVALSVSYLSFRWMSKRTEVAKPMDRGRGYLLDTSTAIDGRIADVAETGLLAGSILAPQFVVSELQALADSDDKQRRTRGRRGLDVLNRLAANVKVSFSIDPTELPSFQGRSVDERLVLLAKERVARLLTHDYNLNKVAQLHGVEVVNLNDLSKALRPVCLPGDRMVLEIVKPGEQPGQGVGYLDDGTMVVVEGGREQIGKQVTLVVTSVLQSSAGRMVFGRLEGIADV